MQAIKSSSSPVFFPSSFLCASKLMFSQTLTHSTIEIYSISFLRNIHQLNRYFHLNVPYISHRSDFRHRHPISARTRGRRCICLLCILLSIFNTHVQLHFSCSMPQKKRRNNRQRDQYERTLFGKCNRCNRNLEAQKTSGTYWVQKRFCRHDKKYHRWRQSLCAHARTKTMSIFKRETKKIDRKEKQTTKYYDVGVDRAISIFMNNP